MKNTIDALALKKAFIAGANNLDNKKDYINEDYVSKKGS